MGHECHVKGCVNHCPPRHLMCGSCWARVPKALRSRVYDTYTPGQENKTVPPTKEWFAAARAAISAAKEEGS